MKKTITYLLCTLLSILCACNKDINTAEGDVSFEAPQLSEFEKLKSGILPYRMGKLYEEGNHILVVYLHGGTSKGNDNESPLKETAVGVIRDYLVSTNVPAIFIIPQCPSSDNWGAKMNKSLDALISIYENECTGVYVLGGSMGGTGTWSLANAYPNRFSGVMPVAGKPGSASAANFKSTRVYAVMSESDEVMKTAYEDVSSFTQSIAVAGGKVKYDQIPSSESWTHANTCEKSYTKERLGWLFET